ncbi:MAG: hypothetical protein WA192_01410 [Candidatus Acidiferrales bacterium]
MEFRMTILVLAATALTLATQNHGPAPENSAERHCEMMRRGDQAMGFSHDKTTHHFLLYKDGGAIEVSANDAADAASRDEIRNHLQHIAKMFSAGDFNVPAFVHGENPTGTEIMKSRADKIAYHFEETARGARVRITTTDSAALQAVHAFLQYQITEHLTGDSLEAR